MFEVKGLSVKFEEREVLKSCSLSFEDHKLYSIIGPNGAGKTTFLKGMAQIFTSHSGEFFLDGKKLDKNNNQKELSRKVAYLEQVPPLSKDITVEQVFHYSRYPYMGMYRDLNEGETILKNQYLKELDLLRLQSKSLSQLSGGELQRVYLGSCLFQEPKVLFLDEPCSFFDPQVKVQVYEVLKNWLKYEKRCVIMVTHDLNDALNISDEIILLKDGFIHHQTSGKNIVEEKLLNDLYETEFCYGKNDHENFTVSLKYS